MNQLRRVRALALGCLPKMVRVFNRFEQNGLLPVFVVTVCIQGAVIVSQFLAALVLTPAEMGVIRSVESVLSVLILIASAGSQSLSIREIAGAGSLTVQLQVLRSIYFVVLAVCIAVIAIVAATAEFVLRSVVMQLVFASSGVVLVSNLLRTTTGFAHGARLVGSCYRHLAVYSSFAVVLQFGFSAALGVKGWIVGRYVGESLVLLGLSFSLFRGEGLRWLRGNLDLLGIWMNFKRGMVVNASLVLRLIADSVPVFAMTAMKVPTDQIGHVGLALLATTSMALPLAVLSQRSLPRMAALHEMQSALDSERAQLERLSIKTAFVCSITLSIVSFLAWGLIGGAYGQSFILTAVLSWVLPLRAYALSSGTYLLVLRNYVASVWVNFFEALLVSVFILVLLPRIGVAAVVVSVFFGAVLSAIGLGMSVRAAHGKGTGA